MMTHKLWQPFWFALALLGPLPGAAQAPESCDPDNPKQCAVPLAQGQEAPFSGQLVTPELAIALAQKADGCQRWTELEVSRVLGLSEAQLAHERELRSIDRTACQEVRKSLETELEEIEERPWWENTAFVASVSIFGTTVILTALYIAAVKTIQTLE